MHPGLRSEKAYSLAQQRVTVAKDQKKADSRLPGDTRSTVSVLIEEGQRHRSAWRGGTIAGFEAGILDHLRGLCLPLKKTYLKNDVLNAIADLGAGLLRLSCQTGPTRFSLRRDPDWNNVIFHSLEELTP